MNKALHLLNTKVELLYVCALFLSCGISVAMMISSVYVVAV